MALLIFDIFIFIIELFIHISRSFIFIILDKSFESLMPLFTVVGSIITAIGSILIALYTQKRTSENLLFQLSQQERFLFVQMNKDEIAKSIKLLIPKINGGNSEEILKFLNSDEGLYVPQVLRNKIKDVIKNSPSERVNELNEQTIQKLFALVNEYITNGNFS